eukprot:1118158-Pyramimonas_sp.AAC.1
MAGSINQPFEIGTVIGIYWCGPIQGRRRDPPIGGSRLTLGSPDPRADRVSQPARPASQPALRERVEEPTVSSIALGGRPVR